jgi:hypothetical protein
VTGILDVVLAAAGRRLHDVASDRRARVAAHPSGDVRAGGSSSENGQPAGAPQRFLLLSAPVGRVDRRAR